MIRAVLFDFGGVIAEEGFYLGLLSIGKYAEIEPQAFFKNVESLIFETGYLTGRASEADFWAAVRRETGIIGTDEYLREEILRRFVIRQGMLHEVDRLRQKGLFVGMLSDQTDWLDELDRRHALYRRFDAVFNSFRIHKSKRDASVFADVCREIGFRPDEVLFVDDNIGHCDRAGSQGLRVLQMADEHAWERGRPHELV